ncbi:MAG TPA: hypothetical protein DCF91_00960 [Porphyromonadaceae bacterium]|nr:hypothetical protein [Porphyromonadaceae bacterium]
MSIIRTVIISACSCLCVHYASAQYETLFQTNSLIDPSNSNKLFLNVDNLSFFQNNENDGKYLSGYTLPGFRLETKLIYYPLPNVKLEGGAYFLKYWGATSYPQVSYIGIPRVNERNSSGVHCLPYLRAQVDFMNKFSLIIGDIYGGANHRLITPLYNPDYNLTADPEAGIQFLARTDRAFLDVWANWDTFIFNDDTKQESFFFGLSGEYKFVENEKYTVSAPLQALFHHKGGELDTLVGNSIQTELNAATGVQVRRRLQDTKRPTELYANAYGLFYKVMSGQNKFPFTQGWAFNADLGCKFGDLNVALSYWQSNKFSTLLGSSLYGNISTSTIRYGYVMGTNHMCALNADYGKSLNNFITIGGSMRNYLMFPVHSQSPEGECYNFPMAYNFEVGLYIRINPSFLLKQF